MMASPEHFARALAEYLEVEAPFKFADIVAELGIRVRQVDSAGFDGALLRLAGIQRGIIAVRKSIPETSKRFTVAHEIGHYILPGHEADCSVCSEREIGLSHVKGDDLEKEANKFAAELLLPHTRISGILSDRGLSLKTCRYVSKTFDTSLTVAAIRCVESSDQKAALVESTNGIVGSFARSDSWKDFIIRGRKIGSRTLAAQLSPENKQEKAGRVPAVEWIWDETGKMTLAEESMLMPRYNTVLSILIQDGTY